MKLFFKYYVAFVVIVAVSVLLATRATAQKPILTSYVAIAVKGPQDLVGTNVALAQVTNIYKICVDDQCVDARDVMRWMQKQIAEMKK